MRKTSLFRLFALLLVMGMLLSSLPMTVVSGEAAPEVNENNGEVSENTVLRDDCWYIAYKNVTTYSLVRSKKAMNLVKAKVLELQENFKKWTAADPSAKIDLETDHLLYEDAGADLLLIEDASKVTNQEIVIGQIGTIGREEIEQLAAEKNIGSADFFIQVNEDGDIWIVGGSNTSTTVAVDFCLSRIFDVNIAERSISVKKGLSYTYYHEGDAADPYILNEGKNALEFVLSPGTMEDVFARLSYNEIGGWRLQNKYSFTKGYNDIGASQLLALSVGEMPDVDTLPLTYEKLDGGKLKAKAPDGSYAILSLKPFSIEFYTPSGKWAQTITDLSSVRAAGGNENATMTLKLNPGEAVYGSGQRFDSANLYGKKLVLYSTDVWDNYKTYNEDGTYKPSNATADSATQSQITVPLFTNPRGSGVFLNRNEYTVADIGKANASEMKLEVTSGGIDLYIFTTESIAEAIGKYCDISGANEAPEEWTYGMIMCRAYPDFADKNKTFKLLAQMQAHNIPWTGIVIQGWSVYDDEKHKDLKELCDYVHSLGKKVIVYIATGDFPGALEMDTTLTDESKLPEEEKTVQNFFMTYKSSSGKSHSYVDATGTVIQDRKIPDFDAELIAIEMLDGALLKANTSAKAYYYLDITNPDAVHWFFDEYWEYLLDEIGVDGAKIDLGYMIPDTAGTLTMYDDSIATSGVHHWYPTAFNALLWEKIASKPDSGLCMIRGGGIGTQRTPYATAPTQQRGFNRLQRQVTSMISSGLSGVAFTSFDIGGAKTASGMKIADEASIFIRSLQISAFSTSMLTAGEGNKMPYDFMDIEQTDRRGNTLYDDEGNPLTYGYVTELYKAYAMLHEVLAPYISECANEAETLGLPVVRHLVLQFAADTKVHNINDQYMLGDAFLVAPMVPTESKYNKKRDIYLPEGKWTNLLTGETVTVPAGGQTLTEYAVSEQQIPVFFNENTTSSVAKEIKDDVKSMLDYAASIALS